MKQFKQVLLAGLLATTLGLSGCDSLNEGYETGKATVEFVELSESMFSQLMQLEGQMANVEDAQQIKQIHQGVIDNLKAQHQAVMDGEGSEILKTMSQFTVNNMVTLLNYNVSLIESMAPMRLNIAERVEALATEQGYFEHKEKLLALQQSLQQLEGNMNTDIAQLSAQIEQSSLHDALKILLTETMTEFNGSYQESFLAQLADLPAMVEGELRWVDYIFEHRNAIQVDQNDQLIFATQEALDAYNQVFAQ